jgi:hypothetical protein
MTLFRTDLDNDFIFLCLIRFEGIHSEGSLAEVKCIDPDVFHQRDFRDCVVDRGPGLLHDFLVNSGRQMRPQKLENFVDEQRLQAHQKDRNPENNSLTPFLLLNFERWETTASESEQAWDHLIDADRLRRTTGGKSVINCDAALKNEKKKHDRDRHSLFRSLG